MPAPRTAVVTLLTFAALARAADPLPTSDDLQTLQDKKDWPGLLAAVSRVLPLKGPATADFDRVDLWMKKAEAQLQSKQFTPASQSFAKAAEEPKVTPEQSDLAKSLSELAKKSDAKGYKTPARLGNSKVYDVFDPKTRPDALAALFAVDAADLAQRVTAAKSAAEAKPLVDLAKAVADLRPLDRVVNKSTDKSDEIEKTLGDNFVASVTKWADPINKRLDDIKTNADTQVEIRQTIRGVQSIRLQRRGVQPNELSEVRKLSQQAEQLAGTYAAVEKAMSPKGQAALKPAETTIQSVYDKAKAVQADAARPQVTPNGTR